MTVLLRMSLTDIATGRFHEILKGEQMSDVTQRIEQQLAPVEDCKASGHATMIVKVDDYRWLCRLALAQEEYRRIKREGTQEELAKILEELETARRDPA